MPPLALRCLDTYGRDPSAILAAFGPEQQPAYANSLEAVYRSDTPSLGTLAVAYGPRAAEAWLKLHLFELGEFSGAKEKLNPYQLRALAGTIATNWGYLRLSELMHFFQMYKTGRFGKFYGSVDGLAVTEALGEYTRIRLEHLRQLDNRDRDERRRADDAAHDLAVASLKKQCDAAGLTPGEAGALCRRHGLTISRVCDMAATPEGRKQLGLPDPDNEQPKNDTAP